MTKISLLSAALVLAALPAFAQSNAPAVSTDTHVQAGKSVGVDSKTQASDSKDKAKDKSAEKKIPPQVAQHPGASDKTDATVKSATQKPESMQKPDAGK